MKFLLSISILFASAPGLAQQYLIRYDILKHETTYYRIKQKDTVAVKQVDLPGSGQLLLQVENYNPFYWNARVTSIKDISENEQSFSDAFNPFSVLAGGMGELMGGLPLLDMPKNRGSINRDDYDAVSYRYLSTLNRYTEVYGGLQKLTGKLEALQLARLQLQELKLNAALPAAEIKTTASSVTKKVLLTDNPGLTTVLAIGRENDNSFNNLVSEASLLAQDIKQQSTIINPEKEFEDKTFKELGDAAAISFTALSSLEESRKQHPHPFTDEAESVTNLYREINAASFQFAYAVAFNDDISGVKLQMYAKDQVTPAKQDTLVQYFEVNKKKGIRIRNSLGVAFTHFSANNQAYYIENATLKSGPKDIFTPVLSTFIHFYTGKSTSFKWGGAFGFGIPLQGERKDVNFMLGLSAVLGRNEAIMLTAGIAGAKVNKLLGGYKSGDSTTETDVSKITTLGYSIGGFIALSLNLNSIVTGKK
ncbi:MAG: hypothetical protein QM791_07075 [Ferruginibacter sp.]